jgi:hypothetical protein
LSKRGTRCTPEQAADAISAISRRRSLKSYSTATESGCSDDYDRAWSERNKLKAAASHEMYQLYGCFSRFQLSPQLVHHMGLRTRENYWQWPDYPRCGLSGIVDQLAVISDLRALRRLKRVGRRKYALELSAKDAARPPPNYDEPTIWLSTGYSTSKNTSATAISSADFKDGLPTPEVLPLVWSERDRWGSWKRVSVQVEDEKQAKLRIIEGMHNGRFNQPGTINNALHGHALHRHDRGNNRNVWQTRRASS